MHIYVYAYAYIHVSVCQSHSGASPRVTTLGVSPRYHSYAASKAKVLSMAAELKHRPSNYVSITCTIKVDLQGFYCVKINA